jgi:alpha-beta hydrolase superfamily lysophospholipase
MRRVAAFVIMGVLAASGCTQLTQKERELTFRVVPGTAKEFQGLPQGVQELDLRVGSDGVPQRIHAWWWPSASHGPAILYLHGARFNLTGQLARIEQLHAFGFSVLAIDYRGFGESDGDIPSEQTVYEDARVAWAKLAELEPDAARRYVYGHSLGGAVAIDLAAALGDGSRMAAERLPAAGLIVDSSFTNIVDAAQAASFSWLPFQWLMSQKFDSLAKIGHVRVPVLLVHGVDDRYLPTRFSEALYDAATAPKRLLLVDGATHDDALQVGRDAYLGALHGLFGLDGSAPQRPSRAAVI